MRVDGTASLSGQGRWLPQTHPRFGMVVLSAGDAISIPGQQGMVGQLLRVCRPGGRIGMVAWTSDGYIGELFAAIGRHLPWGTKERLRELLGPEVAITAPRRSFLWRFPSAELLEVARRFDVSEDDTLVLRLDYLEAVVRKPVWL